MKTRKNENLTLVLNIFSLSLNGAQPQAINHFLTHIYWKVHLPPGNTKRDISDIRLSKQSTSSEMSYVSGINTPNKILLL